MEQINGEISGGGWKSIFLRDKLTGIDTGNEKSSNYFESSTSCFILNRGIDHIYLRPSLVPNPIFIEVFIFIRIQGTERATVNSAKRHKSHMTLPNSYDESLPDGKGSTTNIETAK